MSSINKYVIEDFDKQLFGKISLSFGIPLIAIIIIWALLLHFKFHWQPSLFARQVIAHSFKAPLRSKKVSIFVFLYWLFFFLPFAGFIGYGVVAGILHHNIILGLTIGVASNIILGIAFLLFQYNARGYAIGKEFVITALLCLISIIGLFCFICFSTKPYNWMCVGYLLIIPPTITLLLFVYLTRYHLDTDKCISVLETHSRMDSFISDLSSYKFDNWTRGSQIMPWWATLGYIIVSILSNVGYMFIFNYSIETNAASGAFLLIDFLMITLYYTTDFKGTFFFFVLASYIVKFIAITFSTNYWFIGIGIIYFISASTYGVLFLYSLSKRIHRQNAPKELSPPPSLPEDDNINSPLKSNSHNPATQEIPISNNVDISNNISNNENNDNNDETNDNNNENNDNNEIKEKPQEELNISNEIPLELLHGLSEVNPNNKVLSKKEMINTGLSWLFLTIGVIYLTITCRKYEVVSTEFLAGLTQYECMLGLLIFSFTLLISIGSLVFLYHVNGRVNLYILIMFLIPIAAVFLFSFLFRGYNDFLEIRAYVPTTASLIFTSIFIYLMISGYKYNFSELKQNRFSFVIFLCFTILDILIFAATITLPFVLLKNFYRYIGIHVTLFLIALAAFILFCISFKTNRTFNRPVFINFILSISFLLVFVFFFYVYTGPDSIIPKSFAFYFGLFGIFLAIDCLIFSIVWSKILSWEYTLGPFLTSFIPSCVLSIYSFFAIIFINQSIVLLSNVASFFVCISMICAIYFALTKNKMRMWWLCYVFMFLLIALLVSINVILSLRVKGAFVVFSVIVITVFMLSIIYLVSMYFLSRSETSVLVFSQVFFPVRRYEDECLKTLHSFSLAYLLATLTPWVWGLLATIWFTYPTFGCAVDSFSIVIFVFFLSYFIFSFDSKVLSSLEYIPSKILKDAVIRSEHVANIQIGMPHIEMPSRFSLQFQTMDYDEFIELNIHKIGEKHNQSRFISSLKAQLSVAIDVTFKVAREQLANYFGQHDIDASFLLSNVYTIGCSVKDRTTIMKMFNTIKIGGDPSAQAAFDKYNDYVKQQEERRASRLASQLGKAGITDFQTLVANLNGRKFNDDEFHPRKSGQIPEDGKLLSDCVWVREEDEQHHTMIENCGPSIIVQGGLGDCYFIAAMASISTSKYDVYNLFEKPYNSGDENGCACVYFHYLGRRVPIVVDTMMPKKRNNKLRLARPLETNTAWWFTVVEKAFAKYAGSYSAIDGGNSHVALFRLIGGWPVKFSLDDPAVQSQIMNGKLFQKILRWYKNGAFFCAGSKSGSDRNTSSKKIVFGHAYSILQLVEIRGNQLIQLRNTWANTEWNGDWGDDSPLWTDYMKKQLHFERKDDGIFWMSFKDFTRNYSSLYACLPLDRPLNFSPESPLNVGNVGFFDDQKWYKKEIDSEICSGPNDGAFPTNKKKPVDSNNQWFLRFFEETTVRCILEKAGASAPLWVFLVKNKGKKVKLLYAGSTYQSSIMAKNSELISFEWTIKDINEPWTLFFCRKPNDDKTILHFTIYSDVPIEVTEAVE